MPLIKKSRAAYPGGRFPSNVFKPAKSHTNFMFFKSDFARLMFIF